MSEKTKEVEMYSTRDICLSATLLTMKFYSTRIDFQVEGTKNLPVGYFIFELTDDLKEVIDKFWRGEIRVEPRDFIYNLRSLKSQLTNVYKSPHTNTDSFKSKESGKDVEKE